MPRVYNRKHGDAPAGAVHIGRGTPWGNEFSHLRYGKAKVQGVPTVEDSVRLYELWLLGKLEEHSDYVLRATRRTPAQILALVGLPPARERVRAALAGRNCECWCADKGGWSPEMPSPNRCHGQPLIRFANS